MIASKKILSPNSFMIRMAALILPVYFVFYGPLHENKSGNRINPLWNFIFAGFAIYAVIALIIIL